MKNIKLLLSALSLVAVASSTQAAEPSKGARKMPAPKADVYIIPAPSSLPIQLKYPAEVKAYKNVQVVARVSGVLEKKYFTEGKEVKEGDLLYKIEDKIYKARYDAALASVAMSQAALNNATKSWDRAKKLYQQKALSAEKKDNELSAYEQALASLALATAQLNQTKVDLDYTNVKAPISGISGLKQVDVGDFVSSNPPASLVKITQNEKVYVSFSIPLSDYKNLKDKTWKMLDENPKVKIEVDGVVTNIEGSIDYINVNLDKQTSVVGMRAEVSNIGNILMAGSFVRVLVQNVVKENVITIPQKAVLQNPLGTIVFIENNGRVDVRPVVIGRETGDKYVVAGGPLKSGDKVFVNNFFRLKPGAEVIVDKTINK